MGGGGKRFAYKGCDINLLSSAKELMHKYPNVELDQGHIYDCICKLPDNSIDVFYADNVFEHLLPDEADYVFSEMSKKLKLGAYVLLIIPNRHCGPHDISKHFLKFGETARGFHFMEMGFREITEHMGRHNIKHSLSVITIPKTSVAFCIKSKLLIKVKLNLENTFAKMPVRIIRKLIFHGMGYYISIMQKT